MESSNKLGSLCWTVLTIKTTVRRVSFTAKGNLNATTLLVVKEILIQGGMICVAGWILFGQQGTTQYVILILPRSIPNAKAWATCQFQCLVGEVTCLVSADIESRLKVFHDIHRTSTQKDERTTFTPKSSNIKAMMVLTFNFTTVKRRCQTTLRDKLNF